ncbi:MAG: lamin tail domain-containing protein [Bacteroidia bacterium]
MKKLFFSLLCTLLFANTSAQVGLKIQFSDERGYFEADFDLSLSANDPAAIIHYTTDGSKPSASTGFLYTSPITISTTAFIRAIAFNTTDTTEVKTHTYLFLTDVIASPQMSPNITQDPAYSNQMLDALKALPAVSLVSGQINSNDHIDTEAETSVELIFPNQSKGFSVRCGIQTWGGSPSNPKRSYRLEFKSEYGTSKLKYPLFTDDGYSYPIKPAQSFDKLLLRAGSQDGLNAEFGAEREAQFIRNRFIFDIQMAMGYPAPHGRFVHVFVNGEYMGQYHFMERPDGGFFSSYYGGSKADYEVRKSGKYLNQPTNPSFYYQLEDYAATQDLSLEADFIGLKDYLDVTQAADYLLFNHYLGNFDWNQNHNSWGGALPHPGQGGYKLLMWDIDLTLGNVGGFQSFYGQLVGYNGTAKNGPIPDDVVSSDAFQLELGDRLACHCTEDGLLTPDVLDSMYMLRANQVSLSLIAESARWGEVSFTHSKHDSVPLWDVNDEWQKELDTVRTRFLPQRTDSLIKYYQEAGYYGSLLPVVFSQKPGPITQAIPLSLSNPNSIGTIYYTLDGSDPRAFGGSVAPSAQTYVSPITLPKGVVELKARVFDGVAWSAMCPKRYFVDANFAGLVINEIHYNPDTLCIYPSTCFDGILNGDETEIDCGGSCNACPIDHSIDSTINFNDFSILSINGDAGTSQVMDAGATLFITDNAWKAIDLPISVSDDMILSFEFRATKKGEVHGIGVGNGFSYSYFFKLFGTQDWGITDYENYPADSSWQSYTIPIGTYISGFYNRLIFVGDHDASPKDGTSYFRNVKLVGGEADTSISLNLALEYLEFKNTTSDTLQLGECYFSQGLRYAFPVGAKIAPQELLLISRDTALFHQVYGFAAFDQYAGKLTNDGETLVLRDPFDNLIDSVRFGDNAPWDQWADGRGPSLELIDPALDNALASSWIAQPDSCGSPGRETSLDCATTPPNIVINEVMAYYNQQPNALDAGDWIELYNPSANNVDLSNWQLITSDTILILPAGTSLAANSFLVLVDSISKAAYAHPGLSGVLSMAGLRLNRSGENISLRTDLGCIVYRMGISGSISDERSTYSLSDPSADPLDPDSWYASGNYGGTPAAPNAQLCQQKQANILINEINYRSSPAFDAGDWVELYNATDSTVDISNWEFHEGDSYYQLPDNVTLGADQYLVLSQNSSLFSSRYPWVNNYLGDWSFGLGGDGEREILLSDQRCWVDGLVYNDSPPWPQTPDGQGPTMALIDPALDNTLAGSWPTSTTGGAPIGTPGQANNIADPCGGSMAPKIVINEILYNNPDPAFDTGNWLELYNANDAIVDLSNWFIMDQDSAYVFPPGTTMEIGEYLVIAENPTSLISLHSNIPAGTTILGPLGFQFDNDGERILLYTDTRCLVDSVDFEDQAPWPTAKPDPIIGLVTPEIDNAFGQNWTQVKGNGTPGSSNDFICSPAKIHDGLQLWLQADIDTADGSSIASWADNSGLGYTATQTNLAKQGIYKDDQINGHAVIRFDGANDWYKINQIATTLSDSATVFVLFKPSTQSGDGYYLSSHFGGSNRLKFGHRSNGELIYDDDVPSLQIGDFKEKTSLTSFSIFPDLKVQGYVNGTAGQAWNGGFISTGADRASLGQEFDGSGNDNQTSNHWAGDLAELIVYDRILSIEERQQMESYLAIKYGLSIPVDQHQYYAYNSHPEHQVGLGLDIGACLLQTSSQSEEAASVLRLNMPEDLNPNEFLVMGSNGASAQFADALLDVPAGIAERMNRSWRVSETGEVGRINLGLDTLGLSWPQDISMWVILVDDDGDFTDAIVYSPDDFEKLSFSVDLTEGDYVSFGRRTYLKLGLTAYLSGAYDASTQLMRDDLRSLDLIPVLDPYSGTLSLDSAILARTGPRAPVDWVYLSLRSGTDSSQILAQYPALIQRNGRLMSHEGDSILYLTGELTESDYFISLHHRNHLGIMSAGAYVQKDAFNLLDFRDNSMVYGTNPQKLLNGGLYGLWGGDVDGDGKLSFQGAANDPTNVFIQILSAPDNTAFARNFVLDGYYNADVNLDGQLIFQGAASDVGPIFINILSYPANTSFSRNYIIEAVLPD